MSKKEIKRLVILNIPYVRAGQAVRHDSPPGDERTILATNTGLQPAGPGRHTGIMILL